MHNTVEQGRATMADGATDTQAKSANIGIRATPEEKSLVEEYAHVLGESVSDVLRRVGLDDAVRLARQLRERIAASA